MNINLKRTFFSLVFIALFFLGGNATNTITKSKLTENMSLTEPVYLHLTDSSDPMNGYTIDLQNEGAYLFIENIRPTDFTSKFRSKVLVNGVTMNTELNCRLAVYKQGVAIIPHTSTYNPLTVYTNQNFEGESTQYTINNFNTSLGSFDNNIRSFKLKRGYMATMAVSSDGLAYSRVFIADEADLDISVMPDILDKQVSYIRVMRWNWPSKKGWCQTNSNEMIPYAKMTESTWLYNWDAVSTRTADLDYAPIRQKLGWPSFSTIRSQDDVSHLLSFNEPDHVEQSDVTVDQAIADWPEHLKTGLRLGSPATTDYGWLYNFIDKCDSAQYRVDYIVVHCYWENRTPQQWYNSLKYVHERCGGRGIWIKEWNNGANWTNEWWPSDANEQFAKQKSDLKGILAVLDTAHFIERYSIYNWVEDKRAMILGGSLTPAGELYRDNKPDFAFSRVNEVIPSWTAKAVELNDPEVISGTGVKLQWSDNNYGLVDQFIIERKINDGNYTEIGRVAQNATYEFIDTDWSKSAGTVRYRVKTLLKTNKNLYSREISVHTLSIDDKYGKGSVSTKLIDWQISNFAKDYDTIPALFVSTPTFNNGSSYPLMYCVKNLTKSSFSMSVQPWSYLNVTSLTKSEDLNFFSLPYGDYSNDNMQILVGDARSINGTWKKITFKKPFDEIPVVVVSQVALNNNEATAPFVRNVTTEGFEICVKKEASNTTTVKRDHYAYVAATKGTSYIGKYKIEVGATAENSVSTTVVSPTIYFENKFTAPYIFATSQTNNDDVVYTLRRTNAYTDRVKFIKQQELSTGSSTMARETVGYMVIESDPDSSSTPLDEIYASEQLTVYPTITSDFLRISGIDTENGIEVRIYDTYGRMLFNSTVNSNIIDVTSLETGSYIINIDNIKSFSFMKK